MSGRLVKIKIHTEPAKFLQGVVDEYVLHYEIGYLFHNALNKVENKEFKEQYEALKKLFYKQKTYKVDQFKKLGLHIKNHNTKEVIYNNKHKEIDLVEVLIENKFYYFHVEDIFFI